MHAEKWFQLDPYFREIWDRLHVFLYLHGQIIDFR